MHQLPMSGTRDYKKRRWNTNGQRTCKGLKRYYDKMLLPKLKEKPISQIVIVDHSGGYDSVDGFILAFGDIVREGTPGNPEKAGDPTKIKMVLINVINEKRKPSGKSPIEDPKMAAILARFYPPGEKMLNNIVGGKYYSRLTSEYLGSK